MSVKDVPQVREASPTGSDILIEAFGTEPFWAINVMLGRLTYRTPESPGWTLVQTELTDDGDRLRYTGKLDGQELTLVIGKGTCSDGMSDTVYPLTAKLPIGSRSFRSIRVLRKRLTSS